MKYHLSYIIATLNKVSFLKITLKKLLENIGNDEEIVVVDGGSTDGSKEYLQNLLFHNKIHQFISEPDKNQAHAWNKAMLMANGEILKKIIDDDVFDYLAINKCKNYMLKHREVDVIISNDLHVNLSNPNDIIKNSRLNHYQNWVHGKQPSFTFSDVHLLIRKSALAFVGLYNTNFIMMDWEFALRISYLKINIVYYTGYNALSVFHLDTVSANKNTKTIADQGKKTALLYGYAGDEAEISMWSKIKIAVGKKILIKKVNNDLLRGAQQSFEVSYRGFYNQINELNNKESFTFLTSDVE